MASEPVGQNHLSATKEGQLDTLQPLQQWIFTVPCLRTYTSSLHALHTFTLLPCQSETSHSTHSGCGMLPRYLTLSLCSNSSMFQGCSLFVFPLVFVLFVLWFCLSILVLLTLHLPVLSLKITWLLSQNSLRPCPPGTSDLTLQIAHFSDLCALPYTIAIDLLQCTSLKGKLQSCYNVYVICGIDCRTSFSHCF